MRRTSRASLFAWHGIPLDILGGSLAQGLLVLDDAGPRGVAAHGRLERNVQVRHLRRRRKCDCERDNGKVSDEAPNVDRDAERIRTEIATG